MIKIADCQIEILKRDPEAPLPQGQAEMYSLLLDLADGEYPLQDMVQRCQLRSPLPLWSRLRHLEEKGFIRMESTAAIVNA